LVDDLQDAVHAVVELVVAQSGQVIAGGVHQLDDGGALVHGAIGGALDVVAGVQQQDVHAGVLRSEEHTSELQSRFDLVCRLLLLRPPPSPLFPYTTLFRSSSLTISRMRSMP